MQLFFDWFREQEFDAGQPWLVFGKGPSFVKRNQYDLSSFKTLSLNHAVREQAVSLAHVIDFDVIQDCGEIIATNAEALVIPWVPHVKNAPGTETLEELVAKTPLLQRLDQQGRLLWYNLSTTDRRHGNSSVVPVAWFSIEAVLNLLARAGVRRVRSLGIDGGAAYANEFDDLKDQTLLKNGHESFDRQFPEIAKILARTGLDYAPLNVDSPVRIYVGTLEDQMLAVKVLEYSIRKHASMTVEVFPLHRAGIEVPAPRDPQNAPRTPFSFQRFLIPQLAGHRGRAIYLDSDMQLFADIRRLWTMPFDGADVLAASKPGDPQRRPQFSVMLLDCDRLRWDIREIVARLDSGELNYERLMHEMVVAESVRAGINPMWNSLEHYEAGRTALVHYTDVPTQPWVSIANPLGYLWTRDLFEALDTGVITTDLVKDHVARGWVRPSLLYQIDHRFEDSLSLPRRVRAMDASFVAPFRALAPDSGHGGQSRSANILRIKTRRAMQATLRRLTFARVSNSLRFRTRSWLDQLK
jgi:hypothetical protein